MPQNTTPTLDAIQDLTNTCRIDGDLVPFDAGRCAFDELAIFIGNCLLERVATPHGFEP